MEDKLRKLNLNEPEAVEIIREANRIGFSDGQIAVCQCTDEATIRKFRKNSKIVPCVKQIDTFCRISNKN